MDTNELINQFIEIEPLNTDDFFKVKETLTRMGLVSRKSGEEKPTLCQSCHVLRKRNRYFIVHFKQLFMLDGRIKRTNYTDDDKERTKLIALLLQDWDLIKIKSPISQADAKDEITTDVVVITYAEKDNFICKSKYSIGKKRGSGMKQEIYND